MSAPPAMCRSCGWTGPAPGFHFSNATNITFSGQNSTTCPNCGGRAEIMNGTYDFIGGVVRLVRDADLSLAEILALREAANAARRTGQTPESFAAANPAAAPIVNLIVQQPAGRDWLVIFLMVLALVITSLQIVQAAEYHAEDEQAAEHAEPTTLVITDHQVNEIARTVERDMLRSHVHPRGKNTAPAKPAAKRRPRPPKQYGKNKRKPKR